MLARMKAGDGTGVDEAQSGSLAPMLMHLL